MAWHVPKSRACRGIRMCLGAIGTWERLALTKTLPWIVCRTYTERRVTVRLDAEKRSPHIVARGSVHQPQKPSYVHTLYRSSLLTAIITKWIRSKAQYLDFEHEEILSKSLPEVEIANPSRVFGRLHIGRFQASRSELPSHSHAMDVDQSRLGTSITFPGIAVPAVPEMLLEMDIARPQLHSVHSKLRVQASMRE
ncbi:hypothetical protein T440DRAFT_319413 [Plenodomus tracheiphilus IPT5]|uniref:Uncharacterized protein n=1 Tax=Plenodomus tracheiphilus IPT5 TaxID=1408161 RepID=A0A6A7BCS2_9PLEO|nr:hypothetical protein T440DRAFT_319413 [Plenodomus tracheiphilus IPT5]